MLAEIGPTPERRSAWCYELPRYGSAVPWPCALIKTLLFVLTASALLPLAAEAQCAGYELREITSYGSSAPAGKDLILVHGFIPPFGDDCADEGVDDVHELRGAQWLSEFFGPDVVEPIRLHVPAKRYRCAVEPEYLAKLSPASVQSLKLQGGPFSPEDVERFKQLPHADDAVRLRDWDDRAKIEDLRTPDFEHFCPHVEAALKASDD